MTGLEKVDKFNGAGDGRVEDVNIFTERGQNWQD